MDRIADAQSAVPRSAVEAPPADAGHPRRSDADRLVRRVLFLPVDGPKASIFGAHGAFSTSIAISAVRCLITYIFLPILSPLLNLSGAVGPWLGLVVGAVSAVAITFSIRRFFAADHKYRWHYAAVGVSILGLLVVQAAVDISHLVS